MVVPVTFNTAPTGNYATLSIMPASGSTALVSAILGVAGTAKTLANDIEAIFMSVGCTNCHSASASGGLNLTSGFAAAALINTNSAGCPARFRVTPGDPRRSSSVIIDKIQAAASGIAACGGGAAMPPPGFTLSAQQIQDIVDWVAGGAN
jgi:mono/diheme cytochrome c family protein